MKVNREDLAWAAGLFEGEGNFSFYATKGSRRRVMARLTTTDDDVLQKFKSIVGLGQIYGPFMPNKGKKLAWTWSTTTFEEAQAVVALFWDWLGARRKLAASSMLQQYHAVKTRPMAPFKLSQRHSKEDAIKMRELFAAGRKQSDIAQMFNRSQSSISLILSRKRKARL